MSHDTLATEKRRNLSQIEAMIADYERMCVELSREIQTEEDRAGVHDPDHFAYSTFAKALMARRANLEREVQKLRGPLEDAKLAHSDAIKVEA